MRWIKTYKDALKESSRKIDDTTATIDRIASGVVEDYLWKDNPPKKLFDALKEEKWTYVDDAWGDPVFIYSSPEKVPPSQEFEPFIDLSIHLNIDNDTIEVSGIFKSFGLEDDLKIKLFDAEGINSMLASKMTKRLKYELITNTVFDMAKRGLVALREAVTKMTPEEIETLKGMDYVKRKPFWVFYSLYNNDPKLFPADAKKLEQIFGVTAEQFSRIKKTRDVFNI